MYERFENLKYSWLPPSTSSQLDKIARTEGFGRRIVSHHFSIEDTGCNGGKETVMDELGQCTGVREGAKRVGVVVAAVDRQTRIGLKTSNEIV